jgi:phage tail-like protein
MARPQTTDPYQNFRFHVILASPGSGESEVDYFDRGNAAGFQAVTMPTMSLESVEYKEGIHTFKRKFPGVPSFDQVTLSRGVTTNQSDFFRWINQTTSGYAYRYDLIIKHYHRFDTQIPGQGFSDRRASREIKIYNAFPVSYKPGSDLDSVGSDVSLQEVTLEIERFEVLYFGTRFPINV